MDDVSSASASLLNRGLWGILATPFGTDMTLDEESLRYEVRFFGGLSTTGLVALGVFGEGAALDGREQRRVVEVVAEESAELPVVIGLSSRATAVAVEQARNLAPFLGEKLKALMVQVHSSDRDVLVEHLRQIHEAAGGAGLVLQDYPAASGVRAPASVLLDVVRACPFIAAVKAESAPSPLAVADLVPYTEVPVFGGLGGVNLLDELVAGASGAMTGFSHPEALIETLLAYDQGGFDEAREVFAPWLALANFEGQTGLGLSIRKEILRRRGIIREATVRPPSPGMPPSMDPLLQAHLTAIKAA